MYGLYSGSRDPCTFIVHDSDGVGELEWATVGEDLATYITEEVYRSSCLFNICYELALLCVLCLCVQVDSASKIDFKYGTGTKRGRKPQTGWKYV